MAADLRRFEDVTWPERLQPQLTLLPRQTDRHTSQTHRQTDPWTETQTQRQRDRDRDRDTHQSQRHRYAAVTEREIQRQREREREREREKR
eukprot:2730895-Rhodomonas_salina.1